MESVCTDSAETVSFREILEENLLITGETSNLVGQRGEINKMFLGTQSEGVKRQLHDI